MQNTGLFRLRDVTLGPEAIALHALNISKLSVRLVRKGEKLQFPAIQNDRKRLVAAYRYMHEALKSGEEVPAAAEWLLDNFYLLEENTKQLEMEISEDYLKFVPIIADVSYDPQPRAYILAQELVSHHEGKIDEDIIEKFMTAYQPSGMLKMKELWIFPLMLRIALIKLSAEVALNCIKTLKQREAADKLADALLKLPPQEIRRAEAMIKKQEPFLKTAMAEHLYKRLSEEKNEIFKLLDKYLVMNGMLPETLFDSEKNEQVQLRVLIGNAITSLRTLSQLNWEQLFEKISIVETQLRRDPVYVQMDSASRSYYRECVERIARELSVAEQVVAKAAIELTKGKPGKASHVGWYLFTGGKGALLNELKPTKGSNKYGKQLRLIEYIGSQLLIAFAILWAAASAGIWVLLLSVVPALTIAQSIVNRVTAKLVPPGFIPRLMLKNIERTLVVVPSLISGREHVNELISRLEVHYMANRHPNVFYALLTDFPDAKAKEQDGEMELIEYALKETERLNEKYSNDTPVFFFLHRSREWSKKDGRWMGKERKRGAIMDFCKLTEGDASAFLATSGSLPEKIKYLITLDADTILPRGTVLQLVGAMEHPLNKAEIGKNGMVEEGYGLLQPRIGVTASSVAASRFSRIFAGMPGLDTYTCAISDAYQDLFGEGIFTGKAIIDLDTFKKVMINRLPDNSVLSHDLLEGCYMRSGLISDVQLFDGYPSNYISWYKRQHRWIRGDWQLLPFLALRVKDNTGKKDKNTLSVLSRWKIIDNIRRSLIPLASFLLLLMGFVFPDASVVALVLALGALFINILLDLGDSLADYFKTQDLRTGLLDSLRELKDAGLQVFIYFLLLPHEAYLSLDAIFRTLHRLLVSRRNMLQWVTAADSERKTSKTLAGFYKKIIICPIISILLPAGMIALKIPFSSLLLIVSLLWFAAPFAIYWLCRPSREIPLSGEEEKTLRMVARRTWRYFEELTKASNGFMPPDNFQEKPKKPPANRTSPTNIGLSVLAAFIAQDLGYIGALELLERTEGAIQSIECAEKWNGHLYNWYSLPELKPMHPRYISTVDSGNLIAYLLVAKQALLELEPTKPETLAKGLLDTARLAASDTKKTISKNLKNTLETLETYVKTPQSKELNEILGELDNLKDESNVFAHKLRAMANKFLSELQAEKSGISLRTASLIGKIDQLVAETDFTALYDAQKELFPIGFDIESGKMSKSYYDLLASEARQTDFLAIALGQVDQKHWFKLGRSLTTVEKRRSLLSWSGTMFEYLMPLILMHNVPHTLLDETYYACIDAQRKYVYQDRPWGVSESAFYAFDLALNYQYKAFGVPRIGLKSSLGKDIVISPYSTLLSLMAAREAAIRNIGHLIKIGALGGYGFFEAIDYTPERVTSGTGCMIVKAYMAHHQGMGLAALSNVLLNGVLQRRFHAIPMVRATELLLEERRPQHSIIIREFDDAVPKAKLPRFTELNASRTVAPGMPFPQAHMLSNGNYSVMLTDSGGGYSRCGDIMLNRWRADYLREENGIFFTLYNRKTDELWPAALAPLYNKGQEQWVRFDADKAVFQRQDGKIKTSLEICVPPEYQAEVRRLSIQNMGETAVELEITAYFEVCLTRQKDDIAHPAFGKLFIDAQMEEDVLLFSRRCKKAESSKYIAIGCTKSGEGSAVSWHTDRLVLPGRAAAWKEALKKTLPDKEVSQPLDPVMCMRTSVKIPPQRSTQVSLIISYAESGQEAAEIVHDLCFDIERAFELAWTHAQVELRYIGLQPGQAVLGQRLVSHLIFNSPARENQSEAIRTNRLPYERIYKYGISGELPILLMKVKNEHQIRTAATLVKLHEYLRMKGFRFDLVLIGDYENEYYQPLRDKLQSVASSKGVFLISSVDLSNEENTFLEAISNLCVDIDTTLVNQLQAAEKAGIQQKTLPNIISGELVQDFPELLFYNGIGGFLKDGSEYVMRITRDSQTPLPWSNVISNECFGTLVTERGGGYTWYGNSREYKLTPWFNDTLDPQGELLLLRDEQSGAVWSTMPGAENMGESIVRHGFGYSCFETGVQEIQSNLTVFVDKERPLKCWILTLKNPMQRVRQVSVTLIVDWVLGVSKGQGNVVTNWNGEALTAYNTFCQNGTFAYIAIPGNEAEYTGKRDEIFRSAMASEFLSGAAGGGLDGGAVRTKVKLAPGEKKRLVLLLGQDDADRIHEIIQNYSQYGYAEIALNEVKELWRNRLGQIKVNTPEKSFDLLLNGWLLYQTWSSRLMGRTGFYQAGGAYGFRDQLQDILALRDTDPQRVREHILLCAAHQFEAGDVQHWWHPPAQGVRTCFSDDKLFLPYAVAEYISGTGDWDILDEQAEYLEDRKIPEGHSDVYAQMNGSGVFESIYAHCIRAINHSLRFGKHGLPLMSGGDWNDGMDQIGKNGGESVWLSWFLMDLLNKFIPVCIKVKDHESAESFRTTEVTLRKHTEQQAWDGAWYCRAFLGDGTPIGSSSNTECKIDCISQAWSVIAGGDHAREAMKALESLLISEQDGILRLLAPPFTDFEKRIGYIQDYLPGVRENGGQYTHGAIWAVIAYVVLGEKEKALRLFQMLNPIHHTDSRMQLSRYMGEPYVAAADVYGSGRHTGRAGWTWYTGSAAWMYRTGLEWLLGIRRHGNTLEFSPYVPWNEFEVEYRFGNTLYKLKFIRSHELPTKNLPLKDSGGVVHSEIRFN